jgi:hypothetical protein
MYTFYNQLMFGNLRRMSADCVELVLTVVHVFLYQPDGGRVALGPSRFGGGGQGMPRITSGLILCVRSSFDARRSSDQKERSSLDQLPLESSDRWVSLVG